MNTTTQLPAFRIKRSDGTSYVTSMAASTTLEQARAYFLGKTFTDETTDGKETKRRVTDVDKVPERYLSLIVYRWHLGDCSYNGITKDNNNIKVACDEGPLEVKAADLATLFTLEVKNGYGRPYPYLKPWDHDKPRYAGPMHGGNYAGTSDSRFCRMVESVCGASVSVLPVHDRFEPAQVERSASV